MANQINEILALLRKLEIDFKITSSDKTTLSFRYLGIDVTVHIGADTTVASFREDVSMIVKQHIRDQIEYHEAMAKSLRNSLTQLKPF